MASTTVPSGGTAVLVPPHVPIPIPIPIVPTRDALATGLHGAIGCDYIPASNRLAFVEYDAGNVSVLNLLRSASVVRQETTTLKGTFTLDLDTGVQGGPTTTGDIWWDQQTSVVRRMAAIGGAKIVNLGAVDYDALGAAGLQTLAYASTPLDGNDDATNKLTNGDVFAVLTHAGHYAKVQVLSYGYDIEIQWVSYALSPAYQVLGTGYTNPESIVVQNDGIHAFVSERSGDIVRVSLQSAARSSATAIATGLNAPQQIVLNGAQNVLYAVEYASPGRLLAIDVTTNAVRTIVATLENAVGVALSADESTAYVSEQPATGGRVREVNLQTGTISNVASGFTAPFMLAFSDSAKEHLMVVERDPANRIAIVDLSNANSVTRPAVSLGFRPSATAPLPGGAVLVTCDSEIDEVELGLGSLVGPLLKGIGFVPFDRITTAGLANTSVDPTYFFQVTNAPFGGTLPIAIDHELAWADGAQYYSVLVDGVARSDSWTDYYWNETLGTYQLQTIVASTVAGHTVYPVRNPATVELWFNPDLASQVATVGYADAVHALQIVFYNGAGGLVTSSAPLALRFENSPCSALLAQPNIGGTYAGTECGVLYYTAPTNVVTLAFTASQPHDFATYSFSFERGVNGLTPPSQSGAVTGATVTLAPTVAQLIGTCTIAGFAEYLYVAASATNGEGRQSQYDAEMSLAFVLAS